MNETGFNAFDHVTTGIFILRSDFVVMFWNRCLEDWTGIPRAEIVGTDIGVHYPHLRSLRYASRLKSIFECGPPAIFSSQLHGNIIPSPMKDGQLRVQHTIVTSIEAPDGTGHHALFSIQDVTDLSYRVYDYRTMRDQALDEVRARKETEKALRRSEEKYRTLIENTYDAICHIDLDGKFVFANPGEAELNELNDPEGILGTDCLDNVTEESKPLVKKCLDEAIDGKTSRIEYASVTPVGRTKWWEAIIGPIKDGNGNVASIIRISRDITGRKRMEEELNRLAVTDPLTQANNRIKYEEIMANEVGRVRRYDHKLCAIMMDIDRFKDVNDTHGHVTGDYVLKTIADIVRENIRQIDHLIRWGGEEFIIILPETELDSTAALAERIRRAIAEHKFLKVGHITASFGVTQFEDGDSEDGFVQRADLALYKAKRDGRDRVESAVAGDVGDEGDAPRDAESAG